MGNPLSIIGAVTILAIGGSAVWGWDRHAPIDVRLPIPFVHPHIRLPDSLQTRLDAALATTEAAQDGLSACSTALDMQGASIEAVATASAAKLATSQAELDATRGQVSRERRASAGLSELNAATVITPGTDLCKAWDTADSAVVAALGSAQ